MSFQCSVSVVAGVTRASSRIRFRLRRVVGLHLLEKLLDALDMLLGKIEREVQFGEAPHLETLNQLVANVSRGVFEGLDRVGLFLAFFRAHAHEDPCVFHVRLHPDSAYTDIPFKAGIFQLSSKHGINLVGNLFAHTLVTMMVRAHESIFLYLITSKSIS